jgi:hypothetical protein
MKRLSHFALISLTLILVFNLLVAAPNVASAHNTIGSKTSNITSHVTKLAAQQDTTPKEVAFPPAGGWLILNGVNAYTASADVPSEVTDALDEYEQDSQVIKQVSFTSDGGWIVLAGANGFNSKGIPQTALDKLTSLNDAGHELGDVSFSPDGEWVILYDANKYTASKGISTDLPGKLDELIAAKRTLKHVTFTSDGKWLVLYNENRYAAQAGFSKAVTDVLKEVNTKGWLLNQVAFMPGTSTPSSAGSDATPDASSNDASAASQPDQFLILYGGGVYWPKEEDSTLPQDLLDRLKVLIEGS